MKYWVFDLDGTLIDSFGHYFSLIEEFIGQKISREEKKHYIGVHPSQIFADKLESEKVEIALKELNHRSQLDAGSISTFNSISLIFNILSKNGCRIAVWTSRDLESAKAVLEYTGLKKQVEYLISGDCVSLRKPNPEGLLKIKSLFNCDTHEMVMVGDHEHDMQAGHKTGVFSIRASWHNHWDDGECIIANKQFFCDYHFSEWVCSTFQKINSQSENLKNGK